jgi:hypothetical protein
MGLPWFPFGFGLILCGLLIGLSIANLIVSFVIDPPPTASDEAVRPLPLPTVPTTVQAQPRRADAISNRLADEVVRLEWLDEERERLHDPRFGKTTEERIVWAELLDLELQDIDEQVSRIRHGEDNS